MDMTIVFGPHKISLQATIDHHGPSMYSGHDNTHCLKNLLQRQQKCGVRNDWYRKLLYIICSNVWIDYVIGFGLEKEDGLNYSHGDGIFFPSHKI